ncbi:MAG: PKD domain-containing protein [Bacteroidetes bacterium]|nr:PKD domain-containing protein [Bacteroidota bacterium]
MQVLCLPLLLLFVSCFLSASCIAQYNEWTWMAGDNIINPTAVFGIQGVASPANKPAGRYEGGGEWVDLQGNFWHFGGSVTNATLYSTDLWKFNPVTNEWTWMKGGPGVPAAGVYGVLGIPNIANTPSRRGFASATCVDLQGKFWLFGGIYNGGFTNDLWKYDPLTNEWTWMAGSTLSNQSGIYGTKGIPSPTNNPGGRAETDAMWADAQGNIWMFGGQGYDGSGATGLLNDLWKFDPVSSQWTWMSGSNLSNQTGVYGTMGISASANVPGSRFVYASWKDLVGNFWLFGGKNNISTLDDLWKYDPLTNEWTWMKGTNGPGNPNGTYGTLCADAPANNPPAVYENRGRWEDDCGNFWLWGGSVSDGSNLRNDLWRYSHATGNWTWVSGSKLPNQAGVYGAKGVSAPTNMPKAGLGNLPFRRPNTNELWFFSGGSPAARLNNMWRYVPDKPTASYTFNPNNSCAPANVSFTDASVPGCNEIKSYSWDFGDPGSGINNISTLINPSHTYSSAGSYSVKVVVTNCTASKDSITQIVTINNCGCTLTAGISTQTNVSCDSGSNGSATVAANGGTSPYTYLWPATGQTGITATGLIAGSYIVTVTDANGCTATSAATISSPSPLVGLFTKGTANCTECGCKEWILVNATGGTSPYTYLWPDGYANRYKNKLCPGAYTINIKDKNNCNINITVTSP